MHGPFDERRSGREHDADGLVSAPELGIGMVGYGGMGKAHSLGYTLAPASGNCPWSPACA